MKNLRRSILFLLFLLIGGGILSAATTPEELLENPIPGHWLYAPSHVQTAPVEDGWWQSFGDSTLNYLIAQAVEHNYDASQAIKRIELARQAVAQDKAAYYPNLGLSAGWNRSQSSGAIAKPVVPSSHSDYFSAGISMNWEIDVFGKIRSKVKAGEAGVKVSRAEYDAVMVSLAAEVAKSYLQLRTYQAQYQVATTHLTSQEKILKITEARHEAGIGDMLEVTQAKIVLYTTRASIPGIKSSIRTTANAIATLIGVYPVEIVPKLLVPGPLPEDQGLPAVGMPVDLLRRRPDIVEAECQVAQYAALIGVAKKDFLPTLSLTGNIGTSAHAINNLFGAHSLEYSIAPTLSWTIFDGMARNHNVAEAKVNMEIAIDNYNLTVLNAIEEVQNSISRYNAAVEECDLLEELIEESRKSLDLSLDLYKQGLTAFSNVCDAQQSYLDNQNSLVESRGEVVSAVVSLYQALGGGF